MSYTKQTWESGDIITAEKLNHMEDGISAGGSGGAGGILVVNGNSQTGALDKTWQEIHDAEFAVFLTTIDTLTFNCLLVNTGIDDHGTYFCSFLMYDSANPDVLSFETSSPNGYPVVHRDN